MMQRIALTRSIAAILWLLACQPSIVLAQSVLDRTLDADVLGAPVVWMPAAIDSGMLATRIAFAARVPVVFEAAADPGAPVVSSQVRVDLTGKTVGEALDTLIANDGRYEWSETNGVIVIRPTSSVSDSNDLLNQPVANVNWDDMTVIESVNPLATMLGGTATPGAVLVDGQTFSVHVEAGTVLDVLIAAAHAHGALLWTTPDSNGYHGAARSIGVQTFDGRGAAINVPLAEQ